MWVTGNDVQFTLHLGLALVLGALIGMERQWRQRMAGLRTNTLVSAGAALFIMLSQSIPNGGDETRVTSYVVSGVGFLGAGVIMKDGPTVRGLNTAATLWCSAAIGAISGFGLTFKAVIGALAVLATNILLRPLAQRMNARSSREPSVLEQDFHYKIKLVCHEQDETRLRYLILQAVSSSALVLQSLHSEDLNGSRKVEVTAEVNSSSKMDSLLEQLVSRLGLEKGVSAISWQVVAGSEGA